MFAPIGVDDDFFDLGGYSLLGARLIAEIKDNFQVDLPLPLLGEQPTIAQLAAAYRASSQPEMRTRRRREPELQLYSQTAISATERPPCSACRTRATIAATC